MQIHSYLCWFCVSLRCGRVLLLQAGGKGGKKDPIILDASNGDHKNSSQPGYYDHTDKTQAFEKVTVMTLQHAMGPVALITPCATGPCIAWPCCCATTTTTTRIRRSIHPSFRPCPNCPVLLSRGGRLDGVGRWMLVVVVCGSSQRGASLPMALCAECTACRHTHGREQHTMHAALRGTSLHDMA